MALNASELRKYKYFTSLSDSSFEILAQNFAVESVPKGKEIVKEGIPADSFYFVKQGRFEVVKSTAHGPAKLSIVTSGQGIGEMPLLTNSVWASSVHTLTEAVLYKLPKTSFLEIVGRESAFKNILLKRAADLSFYDKVKALRPFALLEPDRMYAIMARMTERTYALGEDIIVQGEKGDYYYVVKSGRVAVLVKKKGEQEAKQAAVLGEGDGFGEEALIRNDPRNATCRALEETVVYALDKIDFDQIMKSVFLDNIFSEDISVQTYREKYVFIDARVPPEYEQEHIGGAVNIPVEDLRHRCKWFDPQRSYITYCTNDARGMVAAFLLKSCGFNAKCLRGGLGSWEGPVESGPAKFVERRKTRDRRSGEDRRKTHWP